MSEGRNIQGGIGSTGLRWWQQGSTENKPTYFTNNAAGKFFASQANNYKQSNQYYNQQEKLIDVRNKFYANYNPKIQQPHYSFTEAMALSQYGYTGIFGRSPSKETLGLVGTETQQAYALDQLRKGNNILDYSVTADSSPAVINDLAAASTVTTQKYNQFAQLYLTYNDKYGATGYQSRYGHTPTVGTKYGLLFNTNNQSIRKDDVLATQQNNLAQNSVRIGKNLIEQGAKSNNAALTALGQKYIGYADYKLKSNRSKPNQDKIDEMQQNINDLRTSDSRIQDYLNAHAAVPNDLRRALGAAGFFFGNLAGGPSTGVALQQYASSAAGSKESAKALEYMNGLATSDVLKSQPIYWKTTTHGIGKFGLIGLAANVVRFGGRFSTGFGTGVVMASDEAYKAAQETGKWLTNDNYSWGQNVDFKMGDAMWKDMSNRWYDPFAVGNNKKGQHWWEGFNDASNWNAFGEKLGADPVAYTLDALSVVPMVGFAAKVGGVAATTARFGKLFGAVGLTAEDADLLRAARLRAASGVFAEYDPAQIAHAQDLLDTLAGKPHLLDHVPQSVVEDAAKIVGEHGPALDELAQIQNKFDMAPSARRFRQTVRASINGDATAQRMLDFWKAMGYEFNGADKSWVIRTSALFEPRTKVLEAPESVINASDQAVYRLPASPIMRVAKEGYFWIGRGFDKAAIEAAGRGGIVGKIGVKLLDMPGLSYRYNYTKAIRLENAYNWGDTATELQRAANLLKINSGLELSPTMARAIEAHVMGGEGSMPLQFPAIQRQQIQDKIAALPRSKNGEVLGVAQGDLALLQKQLSELLDNQINNISEAAASYDSMFNSDLADLRARLADSSFKADDKMLDAAVDMVKRLEKQDMAVRSRIVHEDTTPQNLEHLKMLYSEAMDGLRLSGRSLFGKSGFGGRVGKFVNNVLRPNTNMLLVMKFASEDRAQILALAQKADETGTVFDDITNAAVRKQREDQMVEAVQALQRRGMFFDGLGSYGAPGRPVLIRANVKLGKDFVAFHIPTLRHTFENGKVFNGKIVDPNEIYVLPKVFFSATKKGKGTVILENADQGRKLLYEGALNAMSDVYPKARFYSEKLNDTGLKGTRANEQMIATEHFVAQSGLRQHALSRIISSQVYYLRSRVERDLRGLAESQAVIRPGSELVGVEASKSGYHVLRNVNMFDTIGEALDFASLRGVRKEADAAFAEYTKGNLEPVKSWLNVTEGMGYMLVDGKPKFIVRGGSHDWLLEATQEDLAKNSTTSAWINREFVDPMDIPKNSYVLALPHNTFRSLAEMTIESNTLAMRLLNQTGIKGWGNLFKWFVLNANPAFIPNNVIGGLAMMLMYNPETAPRIMATAIQKIARESIVKKINNDWFTTQLTNFANDSEAVSRAIVYDTEYNIYKQDAGIAGVAEGVPWYKKYVLHGGYTAVGTWEEMMRRNVAMQFLHNDAGFRAFMDGPEVQDYISKNVDWHGNTRSVDEPITKFEAATDLLLDRSSPYFDMALKHRMRYVTNTVSGNYHMFTPTEQLIRNVVAPFYSWMRHSATFTYRMAVDRPITFNVATKVGEQGYQQNVEQGVPAWMMSTVPAPQVIKDMFGITDDNFRLDGSMFNPYGTTGDMGRAAFQMLTGTDMGKGIFEFTNPYLNELIKSTLGVDPRTGSIDWARLKQNGMSPQGISTMGKDMFTNVLKATYPYKINELLKYKEYEQDSLANKYAAIDNAPDILKNYDPNNPTASWKLSIPKMLTNENPDPTQRIFSALGIKTYKFNPDSLPIEARQDAVGAIVLSMFNKHMMGNSATSDASRAEDWKRKYDYVQKVWLPAAISQGLDQATIDFVLSKIRDERPNSGIAKQLTNGYGG